MPGSAGRGCTGSVQMESGRSSVPDGPEYRLLSTLRGTGSSLCYVLGIAPAENKNRPSLYCFSGGKAIFLNIHRRVLPDTSYRPQCLNTRCFRRFLRFASVCYPGLPGTARVDRQGREFHPGEVCLGKIRARFVWFSRAVQRPPSVRTGQTAVCYRLTFSSSAC